MTTRTRLLLAALALGLLLLCGALVQPVAIVWPAPGMAVGDGGGE